MVSAINLTVMGVEIRFILQRALDLITVILPPALPATLSVGVSAAVQRLKKERILCISTSKINVASKIDRICFDKTGTLTEEGLRLFEIVTCCTATKNCTHIKDLKFQLSNYSQFLMYCLMSSCHSLRRFAGRLVGDPLEIEMFACTGLDLPESENDNRATRLRINLNDQHGIILEILTEFGFSPEIRRMSVVTAGISRQEYHVFTKGSPECLKNLCLPESSIFVCQI